MEDRNAKTAKIIGLHRGGPELVGDKSMQFNVGLYLTSEIIKNIDN